MIWNFCAFISQQYFAMHCFGDITVWHFDAFWVSSCKYWEWKNSNLFAFSLAERTLCNSNSLILPSIDMFLLIVSHYISWSGYWCSSCAVSLWCLLNVSICTPISCFFIHLHLPLSLGHDFVPNHSYLQCFNGEDRGMTVYVFVLFSPSVIIAFGTGWLFMYGVHRWLLRS